MDHTTNSACVNNSSQKKKSRCCYDICTRKIAPIIGLCVYCEHKFCSLHRLPEGHFCENIDKCRENSFKRNEAKLLSEKCVAAKV